MVTAIPVEFGWTSRPATWLERDAAEAMATTLRGGRDGARARPMLRVGVVCDASTSMTDWAPKLASMAWITATSAHGHRHRPAQACSAVVRVGHTVDLLAAPRMTEPYGGNRDYPVQGFPLDTDHARLDEGLRIAETTLGLHAPGPRLVVLITAAQASTPDGMERTRSALARLRRSGCRVLWLCPTSAPCARSTFPGAYPYLIDVAHHRHDSRYQPTAWTALGLAALQALTCDPDPATPPRR